MRKAKQEPRSSSESKIPVDQASSSLPMRSRWQYELDGTRVSAHRRRRRHHGSAASGENPLKREVFEDAIDSPETRARDLDATLVDHVRIQSNGPSPKPVSIRFGDHAASEHQLEIGGVAKMIDVEPREVFGQDLAHWMAPFETPPSLDAMASHASDLVIEEIDPLGFLDQFTPGSADVAFHEQYHWWSKLRSPFIRWEMVAQVPVEQALDEPVIEAPEVLFDEQVEPIVAVPSFSERVGSLFKKSERKIEEVAEEVIEREQDFVADAKQGWGVPILVPRWHTMRLMVGFITLLLVVSLPAGAVSLSRSFGATARDVRESGQAALSDVRVAMASKGGAQQQALRDVSDKLRNAQESLNEANVLAVTLAQALPQTREVYQSTQSLLSAGDHAVQAASLLSQGIDRAFSVPVAHPDERIITFQTYLESATPLVDSAVSDLGQVHVESLPSNIQSQAKELVTALTASQRFLRDLRSLMTVLVAGLGHEQDRTYLVIFQNQTELRPTGGFMGSMAEVTFDRGDIKRVRVPGGGPYDLRNQLLTRVVPPKPLQLVASRWEFQDANWFPDFPEAAKKISWFWDKSGQTTVDGVITINASIMEKLLTVTGPIDMPDYGKTISAENYQLEMQKAVELEYDKTENKPKKIIGDLLAKILERVKAAPQSEWLAYFQMMSSALETKEIQVALGRTDEEALMERFDWNSRLKPSIGDALSVVEANIAGQKTDGVIDEQVQHVADVQSDGSIIDTVTLTRRHNGQKGELFQGANNVEYLRVYVPKGSELLDVTGLQTPSSTLFKELLKEDPTDADVERLVQPQPSRLADVDVTDEFGRTAFGGWIQLEPGQSSVTTFQYRLPFTVYDIAQKAAEDQTSGLSDAKRAAYFLLLTSQSGKLNRTIDSTVKIPDGFSMTWANQDQGHLQEIWDRDRVLTALLDQKP